VTLVENGREACNVATESRPQLVFMDLQMPVMNGYEAAAELRKMGLVCPIVAVTASALKGELERCQAAGMNGILTKPFKLETLDAVIHSYLPRVSESSTRPDSTGPVNVLAPVAASAPSEVFSEAEALKVFLGNRELLDKLIAKFREQSRRALDRLDQGLAAGDAVALRAGAHALKGSAANLTANQLAKAAEVLEHAAADGKLDNAASQIAQIRKAFDAFETATGRDA